MTSIIQQVIKDPFSPNQNGPELTMNARQAVHART